MLWIDTLKKGSFFSEIIVAGHSQGALVGLGASKEKKVDKFISISGAGRSIDEILSDQFNVSFPMYADSIKMFLDSLKHGVYPKKAPLFLKQSFAPYLLQFMKQWMSYDPSSIIDQLKCPILIVNGDNDIQVSVNEAELLHAGNKNSKLLIISEMNHVLKDAPRDRQKNVATYFKPDLPLNKTLVKEIISFIKK
jgi:pimeloyl-ACP methyl ester carboxylesterase